MSPSQRSRGGSELGPSSDFTGANPHIPEISAPTIDFTSAVMPEGLVVEVLEASDRPAVTEGQSITVHYTGWLWDGATFDSSWGRGKPISFVIARGSLIDGWVDGLVGQPVGSKVVLVVPPEAGYGQRSMGPIPGGSTLVFAVDVIDSK